MPMEVSMLWKMLLMPWFLKNLHLYGEYIMFWKCRRENSKQSQHIWNKGAKNRQKAAPTMKDMRNVRVVFEIMLIVTWSLILNLQKKVAVRQRIWQTSNYYTSGFNLIYSCLKRQQYSNFTDNCSIIIIWIENCNMWYQE